ncbi:Zn-ribbon domain-containing OB-fold protein [Salinigranum halophilum]|uniref:Zn-ribbon domain-containing OB-fold protein n=1 Tax=Salinigranum halophilum TaxID=2565931 RepID=UPI0010A90B9F|nr:Zn-ribbon domain-containing OB-fold protein [Salinigranum halophilum]
MTDDHGSADAAEPAGPVSREDVVSESPFTLPGFFDALEAGRLLAAECRDCEAVLVPPRPACYECGSRRVAVAEQSKTGTVYSYTEVGRPPTAFEELAPLTLAVVELDSGGRLTGRVDAAYDDLEVGTSVTLTTRAPDFDEEAVLSYEADWPVHVFELRE